MLAKPSDYTAVIIPVHLPAPLETLRQRTVPDALFGMPAHATLLYPFAPPETLDDSLLAQIAEIVCAHDAFSFRLAEKGCWPDTLYASVEPELPFRALQADLAAAFPAFPIYRGAVAFVPHVTIVEGPCVSAPNVIDDQAWQSLPVAQFASFVDLIVQDTGGWRLRSRFGLHEGGSGD